jgi:hypothetical protein
MSIALVELIGNVLFPNFFDNLKKKNPKNSVTKRHLILTFRLARMMYLNIKFKEKLNINKKFPKEVYSKCFLRNENAFKLILNIQRTL